MEKIAVVTGGTEGIGRAIVEKLIKDGYQILTCARNAQALLDLKQTLDTPICKITFQVADLSQKKDVTKFADFVAQHKRVDVLVNNAGVFFGGTIKDEPADNLPQLIETNLYSAYYLTKALLPLMCGQGQGTVINICSIASLMAYAGGASYAISKHALLGFSRGLRAELKTAGIGVTAILPGATYTRSWSASGLPEERFMPAEDVAEVVGLVCKLSPRTVVEDIVMRPLLGDI